MKYSSGGAFRQALEEKLKRMSEEQDIPLVRLRKQVAFERFIARLMVLQPDMWVLKGGLAMQLRLGIQARTTKDIDLLNIGTSLEIRDMLIEAGLYDLGDWFGFEIGQGVVEPTDAFGGHRYSVRSLLGGRLFEAFHVDIGVGDELVAEFDLLRFDPLLEFAGVPATTVLCYPVPQQIAEKLHALTRHYESGESTRVRDLVDIVLLAGLHGHEGKMLKKAIRSTFEARGTHPVPAEMPKLPQGMREEYQQLAIELSLKFQTIDELQRALTVFLNPVLADEDIETWDASNWRWKKRER